MGKMVVTAEVQDGGMAVLLHLASSMYTGRTGTTSTTIIAPSALQGTMKIAGTTATKNPAPATGAARGAGVVDTTSTRAAVTETVHHSDTDASLDRQTKQLGTTTSTLHIVTTSTTSMFQSILSTMKPIVGTSQAAEMGPAVFVAPMPSAAATTMHRAGRSDVPAAVGSVTVASQTTATTTVTARTATTNTTA